MDVEKNTIGKELKIIVGVCIVLVMLGAFLTGCSSDSFYVERQGGSRGSVDDSRTNLVRGITIPDTGEIINFGGSRWRVLDTDGHYALLLYETVITGHPIHRIMENTTWETSSSRAWLNGEFFNSFTAEDREHIRETTVINRSNPWSGTIGGNDTVDRIFLLSLDEVVHYFGDSGQLANRPQQYNWLTRSFTYANWITDDYNSARIARNADGRTSDWWLRSPGLSPQHAAQVWSSNQRGYINVIGAFVNLDSGFRPALWLDFSSWPGVPVDTNIPLVPVVGETIDFGYRSWRVLDTDGDYALLLHETVIIDHPYHRYADRAVTWASSSVRTWLNGEFFDTFSATTRVRIRDTYVINNDSPWTFRTWTPGVYLGPTWGGANTTDRIFLLSIDEVLRYFGDSGMVERGRNHDNREAGLGFSPEHGIGLSEIHDGYSDSRIARDSSDRVAWWWLRSPGIEPRSSSDFPSSAVIDEYGRISIVGRAVNQSSLGGIRGGLRPAMWVKFSS